MKKALAILAIVTFMFAGAVSASYTDYLAASINGTIPVQLLPGSDQIISIYPQKVVNFAGLAVAEVTSGFTVWGYTILDIGSGVLGISGSPYSTGTIFEGVSTNGDMVSNMVGVQYGTDLGGGTIVGGSLLIGMDSWTNTDPDAGEKDDSSTGEGFAKLAVGATIDVGQPLDLALSLAMPFGSDRSPSWNGSDQLTGDNGNSQAGYDVMLGAATTLSGFLVDLNVSLTSFDYTTKTWTDANADGTPETHTNQHQVDSDMDVNVLVGKELKPTDSISVMIGSGVLVGIAANQRTYTVDEIAGTTTYSTLAKNSDMDINVPFWVSIRGKLNETWSAVASAGKTVLHMDMDSDQDTTNDGETVTNEGPNDSGWDIDNSFNATVGITGVFGDVQLDLLLNPAILIQGPSLISGLPAGLASQIAIVWNFM